MTLRNTVSVDFNVWGIEFDDDRLYAVVDNTNMLASFDNFLSNSGDGMVEATKMIALEGIESLTVVGATLMILASLGNMTANAENLASALRA